MASDGELKIISKDEVASHNNSDSCWIILDDKVYDVTKFLMEHPGGDEVIAELAGQDATDGFNDVGHSSDARDMAKEYLIGRLPEDETATVVQDPTKPPVIKASACGDSWKDIIFSPTWTNFLIPAAISVLVYVTYKSMQRLF
ncbi:hypothetical protein L596_015215 [Steinernema carpocapsae]|uniref:Cytochrome b5 heme-binding domain-containing protein n=1 Tax=Steinernema carpocapsae TaxID=34508 RepID=A0A4U5NF76_STECR|nr:hypothetical protein L596_015215 [Steinernema carpocapsae]